MEHIAAIVAQKWREIATIGELEAMREKLDLKMTTIEDKLAELQKAQVLESSNKDKIASMTKEFDDKMKNVDKVVADKLEELLRAQASGSSNRDEIDAMKKQFNDKMEKVDQVVEENLGELRKAQELGSLNQDNIEQMRKDVDVKMEKVDKRVADNLDELLNRVQTLGSSNREKVEAMRKEVDVTMVNVEKIEEMRKDFDLKMVKMEESLAEFLKAQELGSSKAKSDEENLGEPEFKEYDFGTLHTATRKFSDENKLGEGGFGTVYVGTLKGERLAIKRLSATRGQGIKEFMSEACLLAKLQHRNLVRLVGFCSEEEEKLLIYEYLPNSSLRGFLFDARNRKLLDWELRRKIIMGIARGLQYLHEDSRLTIIHRDLNPANILLDNELNAKIADFGMARLFEGAQKFATTNRIVGTEGYMAPDYINTGEYSNKTDVYSFGIVLLEIVSGQRNRVLNQTPPRDDISLQALRLCNEGRSFEITDPMLSNNCLKDDVVRCIHIGLLCVQADPEERPTMAEVVLMLTTGSVDLPVLKGMAKKKFSMFGFLKD